MRIPVECPALRPFRHLVFLAAIGLCAGGCPNTTGGPTGALPSETARVAIQSQCAQNVITCTRSFPTAVASVTARQSQTVTPTDEGFVVNTGVYGPAVVQLRGSDSEPGLNATRLAFSWSSGATDTDPCTVMPGTEFSTEADPAVLLEPGLHYIRLTVTNDNILGRLESEQCGVLGENIPAFHFVEVEVDVRY
ncbi:MAG: hypothetical protein HY763_06260 [Planctomycetes bacterium]|nr:hypothetical protein [Planctomycetota bacterium]